MQGWCKINAFIYCRCNRVVIGSCVSDNQGEAMNDAEYERREAEQHRVDRSRVEALSVTERKDNGQDWAKRCAVYPEWVGDNVGLILDGNYGYGAMKAAERILDGQGNKPAALYFIIADLDGSTGDYYARKAWHSLTPTQQEKLTQAIQAAIDAHTAYLADCAAEEAAV